MIKHLPQELSETMSDGIEIVNFIKAKALNLQIFFNTMQRNGIRTSVIAILHLCAMAFTRKSSVVFVAVITPPLPRDEDTA